MNVYVLFHDDREYDMGDTYLRGIFATREVAEASIVTRTASGRRSTAWAAHNEACCGVFEQEIQDAPAFDLREDDPPSTGPGLISGAVADELMKIATAPMPAWLRGASPPSKDAV